VLGEGIDVGVRMAVVQRTKKKDQVGETEEHLGRKMGGAEWRKKKRGKDCED